MDTLFQKILGGVGRLQESVGVTPFLKDTHGRKKNKTKQRQAIGSHAGRSERHGVSFRLIIILARRLS